ncbi:hypothetical protein J6590_073697 [Homalodisca vitripennis]|nr:hypothetical protein J6590_073697 [Homalodisca vitripennis]
MVRGYWCFIMIGRAVKTPYVKPKLAETVLYVCRYGKGLLVLYHDWPRCKDNRRLTETGRNSLVRLQVWSGKGLLVLYHDWPRCKEQTVNRNWQKQSCTSAGLVRGYWCFIMIGRAVKTTDG